MPESPKQKSQLLSHGIIARLSVLTQELTLLRMDLGAEDWLQVERRAQFFSRQMDEIARHAAALRSPTSDEKSIAAADASIAADVLGDLAGGGL